MMKKNKQGGSPQGLPQLTRIELTRKNLPLRIVLLVLALAIAVGAFIYGWNAMVSSNAGWTEIKVSTGELNCSGDFVLNYYLGSGELSATEENRQLVTLYTDAAVHGYRLFSNEYVSASLGNLHYVNAHPNQQITVDPVLYEAFAAIQAAGNRSIYLAPAYAEYTRLFLCENEIDAKNADPARDPETVDYIARVCRFGADPEMIDLELLGNNQVRLTVSGEYQQFVKDNDIGAFLDFSWMTNAFITDYIADILVENGLTQGYLASKDGFTRNLCSADTKFTLNVFHRVEKDIYVAGDVHYPGGRSIVQLRDFPLDETDRWHYYAFSDGRIASTKLDPLTGTEKSAVSSLIAYSRQESCVDILLALAPVYLADSLDTQALSSLTDQGIYCVYPQDKTVWYNEPGLDLRLWENMNYSKKEFS